MGSPGRSPGKAWMLPSARGTSRIVSTAAEGRKTSRPSGRLIAPRSLGPRHSEGGEAGVQVAEVELRTVRPQAKLWGDDGRSDLPGASSRHQENPDGSDAAHREGRTGPAESGFRLPKRSPRGGVVLRGQQVLIRFLLIAADDPAGSRVARHPFDPERKVPCGIRLLSRPVGDGLAAVARVGKPRLIREISVWLPRDGLPPVSLVSR
jgi:hypothetical protein